MRWLVAGLLIVFAAACADESTTDPEPASETTTAATSATTTTVAPTTTSSSGPTTTSEATTTTTAAPTTTVVETTTTSLVIEEAILGAWLQEGAGIVVTFADDGTHNVSYINGEPFESGPYTLEGNRLTMTTTEGPDPVCVESGPGVFDIQFGGDASWVFGKPVSDNCDQRRNGWAAGMTRHDPDE